MVNITANVFADAGAMRIEFVLFLVVVVIVFRLSVIKRELELENFLFEGLYLRFI